jgi:hypothetical protein
MMQAKEISKDIYGVDGLLYERIGKVGTTERAEAGDKAFAFYSGAIIKEARKQAKITKGDLSEG